MSFAPTNPLRHYNKTQVRSLMKRMRTLRANLTHGAGFKQYGTPGGLCGALNLSSNPLYLNIFSGLLTPKPYWNNHPKFSGDESYPVPATVAQAMALMSKTDRENNPHMVEGLKNNPNRAHSCAYAHASDKVRWSVTNPYGARRLEFLAWLEAAAKEMHNHFHAR